MAFFVVSIFVYWRFITEILERPKEDVEKAQTDAPRRGLLQDLGRTPREAWILTTVAALSMFAMRVMMSFMVVYAVEVVGLTKTQWGVIGTVVSVISTLLTMPAGMYTDRIGRKPVIIVSRVLLSLSMLGFTFSSNFWHMNLVRSVGGVARGFGGAFMGPMGGPVWQALVADVTPPEERARMMGTITGIASTPASWVGGYLYDYVSPALPFQVSFVLDMIGTAIFVVFLREPRKLHSMEEKALE